MNYTIANLEDVYELELERVVNEIEKSGAGSVLLQLPDGLKPWATCIVDYLSEVCDVDASRGNGKQAIGNGENSVSIRVWLGSCFGACDLPDSDADLVIQFGHSRW